MIRKSWILWYIRKFKDAYLILLCGKSIENLLTRMKLKTLQTLWKLDHLRFFFWNYLDINYVFQSICNMWALCGFNTMPCVIFQWSLDLVSIVFVTTESNPGVIPQFDWLCDVCGCVMSPTSGIYWVDLGFINNYKEPQ